MIFERIKSVGLAHNSYLIGSDGEAAVIDPRRDCDVYIELAEREEQRIRYVFETHRNEDYVIGSGELSNLTEAEVFHGPGLDWRYGSTLHDGEAFRIGSLEITALHTPGHTDESMSYALADLSSGEDAVMVSAGDALFVGDAGRTDFYGHAESGGLVGALCVGHLESRLSEVPRERLIIVVCNGCHRASLAASILLRVGTRIYAAVFSGA